MTHAHYTFLWQNPVYVDWVRSTAANLKSDGCSGPAFNVFKDGCLEHDIHYRLHRDYYWDEITKAEADERLRWYVEDNSWFGKYSPLAKWRYWALRTGWGSNKAWEAGSDEG